ncbi:unnamed protein product [Closterium sp. NIES-65]|nr:unnamed protein product [Closterium sp. NIES-65]
MGGCVSIEEDPRGRFGPAPGRSSSRATHSNRVAPQSPSTASKRSARKSSPMRSPSSASASASAYRSGGLLPKSNESNISAASGGSGSGRRSCPQTPRGSSASGFRTPPGSGGLGSGRRGGALADRTSLANSGVATSSLREFSYQELWIATRKFEKEGKLGEGGFGSVFRGTIEEDVCASGAGMGAGSGEGGKRKLQVAVKVLNQGGQQGETEWKTEVRYLSELRHPNLVRLVGYCSDGHHRLLAYEYLPYGSLERFLFTREFLAALPLFASPLASFMFPCCSSLTRLSNPPLPCAIQPLPWAVRMKGALHAAAVPVSLPPLLVISVPVPPLLPPFPLPFPPAKRHPAPAMGGAHECGAGAARGRCSRNHPPPPPPLLLISIPVPPLLPSSPFPLPGAIQPLPWAVRMKVALHADARPLAFIHVPVSPPPLPLFRHFPPSPLPGAIQPLPWAVRMKVALQAAQGLAYLHEEADRQIIYRDFKASNILLDEDFNAKLSDFGLAKDGPEGNQTHVSTRVMGTYGYAAPEYMMTGHLTAKSDVYSFGVVLLEMISGRRAMEPEFPRRQQNIVEWARPFLVDPAKMLLLVDPRVGGEYSVKGAQRAAVLARKCLNKDPHARPLMSEAVRVLSSIQNLTDLASKLEQAQRLHGA